MEFKKGKNGEIFFKIYFLVCGQPVFQYFTLNLVVVNEVHTFRCRKVFGVT